MPRPRRSGPTPTRQEEQRRLLELAQREPGISDAIAAYERLAGLPGSFRREVATIGFSTGGNSPTNRRAP
jgi:dienelactone hydrolase